MFNQEVIMYCEAVTYQKNKQIQTKFTVINCSLGF